MRWATWREMIPALAAAALCLGGLVHGRLGGDRGRVRRPGEVALRRSRRLGAGRREPRPRDRLPVPELPVRSRRRAAGGSGRVDQLRLAVPGRQRGGGRRCREHSHPGRGGRLQRTELRRALYDRFSRRRRGAGCPTTATRKPGGAMAALGAILPTSTSTGRGKCDAERRTPCSRLGRAPGRNCAARSSARRGPNGGARRTGPRAPRGKVTRDRLSGRAHRSVIRATVWLAVVLGDPELRRIVDRIAQDRTTAEALVSPYHPSWRLVSPDYHELGNFQRAGGCAALPVGRRGRDRPDSQAGLARVGGHARR